MEKIYDAPAQHDDQLTAEVHGGLESSVIQIVGEKAARHLHELPEAWLRSRVRGWMELNESPDLAWWIGTYTAEGTWIWASSRQFVDGPVDAYQPKPFRQDYAMRVAKHLNANCNFGGAWLAGWFRGGREFYLLWKDSDGDIHIPIECNKPFVTLARWPLSSWERQACTAYATWREWKRNVDVREGKDTIKAAQGERASETHLRNAPA